MQRNKFDAYFLRSRISYNCPIADDYGIFYQVSQNKHISVQQCNTHYVGHSIVLRPI